MSVLNSFNFFRFFRNYSFWDKTQQRDPIDKNNHRKAAALDNTRGQSASVDKLYGLFYGENAEFQFSSPYAYTPIQVPASLMGIPIPVSSDKKTHDFLQKFVLENNSSFDKIHQTFLLLGTAWRWVRWCDIRNKVVLQAIVDDSVSDIELFEDTDVIKTVWTFDNISRSTDFGKVKKIQRVRQIDRENIKVSESEVYLDNVSFPFTRSNTYGTIPIPFSHDPDDGKILGHSVFCRSLRTF
jgi:hypothetical protein